MAQISIGIESVTVRRKYVSRQNPEDSPVIAEVAGTLPPCGRTAGANHREQICGSSSALPAGADLLDAAPGLVAEAKSGPLGGDGGRLVPADLPLYPIRRDGRRLRPGRRNAGTLSRAGKGQNQDRLLLDGLASRRGVPRPRASGRF